MHKSTILKIIKVSLIFAGILLSLKTILFFLPYHQLSQFRNREYSTCYFDRNSVLVFVAPLENGLRREYRSLDTIPVLVRKIFIKAEDKRFYFHPGFDIPSLVRAVYFYIKTGEIKSGGSTITMQLSRLISPHPKNWQGKLTEIINAVRLESKLSKREILELWFNSLQYGSNTEGVGSAGKVFYGMELDELSIPKLLALAVIPRSPGKYSICNNIDNLCKAAAKLGVSLGYDIKTHEFRDEIVIKEKFIYFNKAPHFINYVMKNSKCSPGSVKTSLDMRLQDFANHELNYLIEANLRNRITNGAVIVLKNNTGEILCYIGSKDFYDDDSSGQIDGIHIKRQPGSTLKPYLYAYSFEKGYSACDIVPDIPTIFGSEQIYIPMNFNNRFNGPVRIRVALASSLNIPAVYMVSRLGVRNFTNKLIDWGFDSLIGHEDQIGSGIAIGDAEVTLFENTRSFASFPRGGEVPVIKWEYQNDEFIPGKRVISKEIATLICDILSDKKSRIPGFGNTTLFDTDFDAAFKTGTSNQFNNIWTLGATTDYTVGIWMGNFDGNTVIGKASSSIPAKLARDILVYLSEKEKPADFKVSKMLKEVEICTLSGMKATHLCPHKTKEFVYADKEIEECSFHKVENGEAVTYLPEIYKKWIKNSDKYKTLDENSAYPSIVSPNDNSVFYYDHSVSAKSQGIKIEVLNGSSNDELTINVNNKFYRKLSPPYKFFFPLQVGSFNIEVIGESGIDTISFVVK